MRPPCCSYVCSTHAVADHTSKATLPLLPQELDGTNLVIGRVVEGLELIDTIGALPINPPRYDNAYFNLGKAIGDKRAITTEKGEAACRGLGESTVEQCRFHSHDELVS